MFYIFTSIAKVYFRLYVEENCPLWVIIWAFEAGIWEGWAEGIENILGGKNDSGKVRVTITQSVIGKILDHFNASMSLFLFTSLTFQICMSSCLKWGNVSMYIIFFVHKGYLENGIVIYNVIIIYVCSICFCVVFIYSTLYLNSLALFYFVCCCALCFCALTLCLILCLYVILYKVR